MEIVGVTESTARSIQKFLFLASMNFGNIRDKIFTLPYLEFEEEFEAKYTEIKDGLESKKFNKSLNYLERMYKIKNKWQKLFYLNIRMKSSRKNTKEKGMILLQSATEQERTLFDEIKT